MYSSISPTVYAPRDPLVLIFMQTLNTSESRMYTLTPSFNLEEAVLQASTHLASPIQAMAVLFESLKTGRFTRKHMLALGKYGQGSDLLDSFHGNSYYLFRTGQGLPDRVDKIVTGFHLNGYGDNRGIHIAFGPSYTGLEARMDETLDEHLGPRYIHQGARVPPPIH